MTATSGIVHRQAARGGVGQSNIVRALCSLLVFGMVALLTDPASAYRRPGSLREISGPDGGRDATISANGRYVAFNTSRRAGVIAYDRGIVRYDRVRDRLEAVSVAAVDLTPVSKTQLPSMNGSGRYVAFQSTAPNSAPGDTNRADDIFVRDMVAGKTTRASVADRTGEQADGYSAAPSISGNGRYVAFQSDASNLTGKDNGRGATADKIPGIFVRDLKKGRTRRVPLRPSVDLGLLHPVCEAAGSHHLAPQKFGALSVSNSGRFVAFSSDANNLVPDDSNRDPNCSNGLGSGGWDVYVFDMKRRRIERVSVTNRGEEADGDSTADEGYEGSDIRMSATGRYVSFQSSAPNLIPSDTNGVTDIFVYDRKLKRVERVSVDPIGREADDFSSRQSMSLSGRYITFVTAAKNLDGGSGAVVFDRRSGSVNLVSHDSKRVTGADLLYPAVSNDGRYVAFQTSQHLLGDRDRVLDLFMRDRGAAVGSAPGAGNKDPREEEDRCRVEAGPQCLIPLCIGDTCVDPGETIQTRDRTGDVEPALGGMGADLYGASLVYRPQYPDLFAAIELEHMPKVLPGVSPIFYGLSFEVEGKTFEVRATSLNYGTFGLFDCTRSPTCTNVADLRGGYGTTGMRVVFSLPLDDIGLKDGGKLKDVVAFSALGSDLSGATKVLDRVRIK